MSIEGYWRENIEKVSIKKMKEDGYLKGLIKGNSFVSAKEKVKEELQAIEKWIGRKYYFKKNV